MNKPTVLFVDDEPNILNGLKRFTRAKRSEWNLLFAEGGEKALSIFNAQQVDVLIADMRMPGLDGAELMQRVSETSPATMRIILSGEADLEQVYRTIGRSHRFLSKPCDPLELVKIVERLLRRRDQAGRSMAFGTGSVFDRLIMRGDTYKAMQNALHRDTPSMSEVLKAALCDPNLAARILQIVNSGYFGRPVKTCSIERALEFLGLERVRDLFDQGRLSIGTGTDTSTATDQAGTYRLSELAERARGLVSAEGRDRDLQTLAFALGLFCSLGRELGPMGDASPDDKYLAGHSVVFTSELLGLPTELTEHLLALTEQRIALSSMESCAAAISQTVLAQSLVVT